MKEHKTLKKKFVREAVRYLKQIGMHAPPLSFKYKQKTATKCSNKNKNK